ncbi:uncharacterized protein LOC128955213 [Oppia nitens]|uniref:uncharacterized protein LOC128955213 n=1 Tax=Oppia nitens TaxID=1686743 RepID=UPI0023D9F7DD|nr:uncharacterized protein LOC128955213 [Oppia nitens]
MTTTTTTNRSMSSSPKRQRRPSSEDNCRQQQSQQQRDSFDRFGDDLAELLLGYLGFDRRVGCECVSRQWRRIVYRTQRELRFGHTYSSSAPRPQTWRQFETIVRKCSVGSITRLEFTDDDYPLNDHKLTAIIKHLPHLLHVSVESYGQVRRQTWNKFFDRFGRQLRSLRVDPHREDIDYFQNRIGKYCPNLRSLDITNPYSDRCFHYLTDAAATDGHQTTTVFNQLQRLSLLYANKDTDRFERFVANYGRTMRTVSVMTSFSLNRVASDILLTGLSQMSRLVSIEIKYYPSQTFSVSIGRLLPRIGQNLSQLKRLSIEWYHADGQHIVEVIDTLNRNFRHIQRLELKGMIYNESQPMSAPLDQLTRLTHLKLNVHNLVVGDQPLLARIDRLFPRLRYLFVTEADLSPEALKSLCRLKRIQYVYITFPGEQLDITVIRDTLLASCPTIREVSSNCALNYLF